MAKARTVKQKAALRKAQLASARKRKGRGLRTHHKVLIGVGATAAVVGVGTYAYHKSPAVKRHVHTAGRSAKRHAMPVGRFVGGMVKSPMGAVAHLQAAKGAVMGKKAGKTFLESSYNWHKMERQHPGQRMYTVG